MSKIHESGMSGRSIGNDLMLFERDIVKLLKHSKYRYYLSREETHYALQIVIEGKDKTFSGRDPDILAMLVLDYLKEYSSE